MARPLDPRLQEILKSYDIDTRTALWDCKGATVILHKAVEQIGAKAGVVFDSPIIIEADSDKRTATMIVTARLGEHSVWSVGEASPGNNKNAYHWSMAEKRGKDRCILKLVGLHGYVFSEDEADDFQTKQDDDDTVIDAASEDESASARDEIIDAFYQATNTKDLQNIGAELAPQILKLTEDHQQETRKAFSKVKRKLIEAA